jgi:hypothetical protein
VNSNCFNHVTNTKSGEIFQKVFLTCWATNNGEEESNAGATRSLVRPSSTICKKMQSTGGKVVIRQLTNHWIYITADTFMKGGHI